MLISRIYEPKPDEVLYHYCSVDTFTAICRNKTIRFSDVNMLNDREEFRWGYAIFEEAATQILNDASIQQKFPGISEKFFDKVDEVISPIQLSIHPVIASFSRNPDLLSQWRGYGENGKGFSVGIRGEALKTMPVTVLEIEYDKIVQVKEMKMALLATYLENVDDKNRFGSKFRESCALIGTWMLGFKNPSFAEEKEIRCVHALAVRTDNGRPRLFDEGGLSGKKSVKGQQVQYRVNDSSIVAYIDIPIPSFRDRPTVQEIWVGPKNANGPGNIVYFMSECGLKDYSIHSSQSSYR